MYSLEGFFKERIAVLNGVRPEEITPDYIEKRRAELYQQPGYRIEFPTNYGGYNTIGLRTPTPLELDEMARGAGRFLGLD